MVMKESMARAAALIVLAAAALFGCSKSPTASSTSTPSAPPTAATIPTPTAPKTPVLGDDSIANLQVVATVTGSASPLDATPDAAGTTIFFSVSGTVPGIFSVPAAGGPVTTVTVGAPLRRPQALAPSVTTGVVYVADPVANRVFRVSSGHAPTVVTGTAGYVPRGLDVISNGTTETVYFTGISPADHLPGLFSVPGAGGKVSTVAHGGLFKSPDAVTLADDGTAYVSDRGTGVTGTVLQVKPPTVATTTVTTTVASVTTTVASVRLGSPGGLTLTKDGQELLVSSLNPATGNDQLLVVNLASGASGVASKVIGVYHASAGGLHRARDGVVMAWADVSRSGHVYRVDPAA